MSVLLFVGLWLMLQSRQLAQALKAKAEADHRLRLAQLELMRAVERQLAENNRGQNEDYPPPRWSPGRN